MRQKRVLILGAGFMQGVALRVAKARGLSTVAVDGNPNAVCRSLADRFKAIDLKDKDAILDFARELSAEGGLDGVFTAATDFSASVAWVAQALGLPGHGYEAALNASDKLRMRACFKKAGVPSPRYVGVEGVASRDYQAILKAASIQYPLVVKPVDNMGARGCRMVTSPEELEAGIADAVSFSRTGRAIIEEYMDGPEYSIEGLLFDGKVHITGLADRHIFFPPYFIEMGHTIPADTDEASYGQLVDVFEKAVFSLGLSHGAVKGDIKLTNGGAMVGEIAGRLSGGYMSGWTFPYSSGIDLTSAALSLALGETPPSLQPTVDAVCAERAWLSIPGVIASVSGLEKAQQVACVKDVLPKTAIGDRVSFPVNNVEKCGNCLALAPERKAAIEAAEEACSLVIPRLKAHDSETDAFFARGLQGKNSFPPDAFDCASDINASRFVMCNISNDCLIPVPTELVPVLDLARDWQKRTLKQACLQTVLEEPALPIRLTSLFQSGNPCDLRLLRMAWTYFLRGSVQGMLYWYDCESNA